MLDNPTLVELDNVLNKRNICAAVYHESQQQHVQKAETHHLNLCKLWQKALLSLTPKMHTLLTHSIQQMRAFHGIGDTIEGNVEMMHQISTRIELCIGRMNNKGQEAFSFVNGVHN
jgi:hypothetical protein